jgi:hypothetical protein
MRTNSVRKTESMKQARIKYQGPPLFLSDALPCAKVIFNEERLIRGESSERHSRSDGSHSEVKHT